MKSLSRLMSVGHLPFLINSALLHESDISQLSSESFNQMIDMISDLFIVDPETA
jgi:hypothetical protein